MKESMQFASITGIVNTVVLNVCNWMSTTPEAHQLASNVAQALSPFAALCVMKLYAKIVHPPALVRKEAALAAAIVKNTWMMNMPLRNLRPKLERSFPS